MALLKSKLFLASCLALCYAVAVFPERLLAQDEIPLVELMPRRKKRKKKNNSKKSAAPSSVPSAIPTLSQAPSSSFVPSVEPSGEPSMDPTVAVCDGDTCDALKQAVISLQKQVKDLSQEIDSLKMCVTSSSNTCTFGTTSTTTEVLGGTVKVESSNTDSGFPSLLLNAVNGGTSLTGETSVMVIAEAGAATVSGSMGCNGTCLDAATSCVGFATPGGVSTCLFGGNVESVQIGGTTPTNINVNADSAINIATTNSTTNGKVSFGNANNFDFEIAASATMCTFASSCPTSSPQ